jgi:hypothetical protein
VSISVTTCLWWDKYWSYYWYWSKSTLLCTRVSIVPSVFFYKLHLVDCHQLSSCLIPIMNITINSNSFYFNSTKDPISYPETSPVSELSGFFAIVASENCYVPQPVHSSLRTWRRKQSVDPDNHLLAYAYRSTLLPLGLLTVHSAVLCPFSKFMFAARQKASRPVCVFLLSLAFV